MRDLLAIFISVQMSFAPVAYAADDGSIPPIPELPKQSSTPSDIIPDGGPQALDCKELKCSKFFVSFEKVERAQDLIRKQLTVNNRGRRCAALKEKAFLDHLMKIYDEETEAGNPAFCKDCRENYRKAIAQSSGENSKAHLREIATFTLCENQTVPQAAPPPPPPAPATPEIRPAQPYLPPAEPVAPPPRRRAAEPPPPVDDGFAGGGSFMNSNLMWGIGGLAIGGLLGYMIGKNSAQNQYQYQMPYWQQLRPPYPPFGQVPPPYGGNPFINPGLQERFAGPGFPGAFGGAAPNVLPYGGQFGQPGFNPMNPGGGYGTPFGNYNLGTQFSGGCGFCSPGFGGGYTAPIYNYGTPPNILPVR